MEEMLTLKCNFCSKEISCPIEEKDASQHACFECYRKLESERKLSEEELEQIQVDVPVEEMNKMVVGDLLEEIFPSLWEDKKDDLKEFSKKELAEFMFAAGASAMGERLAELGEEEEEAEEDDEKE